MILRWVVTLAVGYQGLLTDAPVALSDAARRYRAQTVLQRLHQAKFRRDVIVAYETSCAICRLRHGELLDAAQHSFRDSTNPRKPPRRAERTGALQAAPRGL